MRNYIFSAHINYARQCNQYSNQCTRINCVKKPRKIVRAKGSPTEARPRRLGTFNAAHKVRAMLNLHYSLHNLTGSSHTPTQESQVISLLSIILSTIQIINQKYDPNKVCYNQTKF